MAKILVVEDNPQMLEAVRDILEKEHYVVQTCETGKDAAFLLKHYEYDMAILDWQLPDLDGIEVLRAYRAGGGKLPILMLTGQSTIDHKEEGLDSGADDYLTKPFDARELRARVRALLRRPDSVIPDNVLTHREITLDPRTRKVSKNGTELTLMPKEFQLLEFFMRHPDEVFSNTVLMSRVWPDDSEATEEALKSTLKRLRRKIDPDGVYIENIHGAGYVLRRK